MKNIVAKYSISNKDIYNFNETGFQMSVISARIVMTSSERVLNVKLMQPGNREWATVIQGVGGTGFCVPPFVVLAGKYHLSSWYEDSSLPRDWVIATSQNGWTINEIGLDWIRYFNKHTLSLIVSRYWLLVLDGHESH